MVNDIWYRWTNDYENSSFLNGSIKKCSHSSRDTDSFTSNFLENLENITYICYPASKYEFSCISGRSLSVLNSSQVVINPDIPEAHELRGWFDNVGSTLNFDEFKSGPMGKK